MIHQIINDQLNQIISILIANKVEQAYLFGSACTENFNEKSDVDIIVEFSSELDVLEYGNYWWKTLFALEDFLQRPVDMLTENNFSNPYFKMEVDRTKVKIL